MLPLLKVLLLLPLVLLLPLLLQLLLLLRLLLILLRLPPCSSHASDCVAVHRLMPITVGTDFAGLETPLYALRTLGVKFKHVWSCEKNMNLRRYSCANYGGADTSYSDAMTRTTAKMKKVDLCVAGPPCPAWSQLGKRGGLDDERGPTIYCTLRYIETKLPNMVVLEQVQSITRTKFKPIFKRILARLTKAGYTVHTHIVDTADHGIPHMRHRLYIVAFHGAPVRRFHFPKPLKMYRWSLRKILKKRNAKHTDKTSLTELNARNVARAKAGAMANGVDVDKFPVVVDIDSSEGWSTFQVGKSPCLTRSRCNGLGYYVLSEKRRLFHEDMIRLQGMNPNALDFLNLSEAEIRQAAGNAMSANVLVRILSRGLYSAGLVDHRVADPYNQ